MSEERVIAMNKCTCCKNPAKYSILLSTEFGRYYIPNQVTRADAKTIEEVWFCTKCMRAIEDTLRATILYLSVDSNEEV